MTATDVLTRRFHFRETGIAGAWEVHRQPIADERGTFARLWDRREFGEAGIEACLAQVNLSTTSRAGTLRGMHLQLPPFADTKLVTCRRGRVLDVALDLRAGSPTFLEWRAVELSDSTPTSFLIPAGCAHGFQTLTDDVELVYLHSAEFVPEADAGVSALDPRLAIDWPLPITVMSARDRELPPSDRFAAVDV